MYVELVAGLLRLFLYLVRVLAAWLPVWLSLLLLLSHSG